MKMFVLSIGLFISVYCLHYGQASKNVTGTVKRNLKKSDEYFNHSSAFNQKNGNWVITRASHHLNTNADEYLPIPDKSGKKMFFTGMDRTGYFDFKLNFTTAKNAGGEDIFYSEFNNGVWSDARPMSFLNTNSHESVSDVKSNGDLIVIGNYPENIGPSSENHNGSQTTDIFLAKRKADKFQIIHFSEPLNSIYNEFDAISDDNMGYMLFVSDRPGSIGEYHKKGWLWNSNRWGNTDVYVSLKEGDEWQTPINLGKKINTAGAERSPWLSSDGLTLYVSSNGIKNKGDLDVYFFKRKNKNDWKNWEGPFLEPEINTENDDWGYKKLTNGSACYASSKPFSFQITQKTRSGDGGIRETNYRSGYTLHGAQSAALKKEMNTDIYFVNPIELPQINISDVMFEFGKYSVKSSYLSIIENIVDYCNQNPEKSIKIIGHTDNVGKNEYNQKLSTDRAIAIKNLLLKNGVNNMIEAIGMGPQQPLTSNDTESSRAKNRRVEIYFK